MNRIATATIIKGSGIPLKIIDDRLEAETVRVQQEHEAELAAKEEELRCVTERRNRLLKERMETLNRLDRQQRRRETLIYRVKERIVLWWAWIFCLGLGIGLWVENRNG